MSFIPENKIAAELKLKRAIKYFAEGWSFFLAFKRAGFSEYELRKLRENNNRVVAEMRRIQDERNKKTNASAYDKESVYSRCIKYLYDSAIPDNSNPVLPSSPTSKDVH